MPEAYTAAEMRELDRKAIEDYEIPGLILMENAGRGAAEVADMMIVESDLEGKVVICCGSGNNGGDGFVIARHLKNWEYEVETFLIGTAEKVKAGDAATNFGIAQRMNISISEITDAEGIEKAKAAMKNAALVVDALFGTGLQREVGGFYRDLIEAINDSGKPVLAVDIPSGLCSDTGKPLGVAVKANATATFGGMKVGLTVPEAEDYAGEVTLIEISIPHFLFEK
ncbi:MAG: NAD(P)H-hydrate epimerase [Planctomycetota bacterium]|nr:MAG: NAD(P)H-hydrate epimerase [Planctomycetota bacterium]